MLRKHFATQTVSPLSRMHVMTVVAAEQQTMNFYMNTGPDYMEPIARGLYLEIAQVEEEHVSHDESLLDPLDSWLANLLFHEANEVYLYWSMFETETDPRIKQLWEPEELLPPELPGVPLTFEPNKQYVRDVLAATVDLRTDLEDYATLDSLPKGHRFFKYQDIVNAAGSYGEDVIDATREARGQEYRDETDGPNPAYPMPQPAGQA